MRENSRHSKADRGHNLYPTCPEAIASLLAIEHGKIPHKIWEPCCGRGHIVYPMLAAGYRVVATDWIDWGHGFAGGYNYLVTPPPNGTEGIVTNPPFDLATEMVTKAIREVPYSAWLLPLTFLESVRRQDLFARTPPARIWVSSRRLPMMHRDGWTGPEAGSNKPYCWMVWDGGVLKSRASKVKWFDWTAYSPEKEPRNAKQRNVVAGIGGSTADSD